MDETGGGENPATNRRGRRGAVLMGLAGAAGLGIGVAVAVAAGAFSGAGGPACAAAAGTARALDPLATGPLAGFQPLEAPVSLAALSFEDAAGETVRLGDFSDRTVLFNLWATWCAPCRAEMPSLARLQQALGGPAFEVVAVSIDTRADAPVDRFLEETGADDLALYRDDTMAVFNTLKEAGLAVGMPTTLLLDDAGCAVGVLHGPAEWDAPEAVRLVKRAMAEPG